MASPEDLESLRDSLEELRKLLRKRYPQKSKQVTAQKIRSLAADVANRWLTDLSTRSEVRAAIASEVFADCTVGFQMILRFSEQAATRGRYESAISDILHDFGNRVLVPVRQNRQILPPPGQPSSQNSGLRIFVGHSFAPNDRQFVEPVVNLLQTAGLTVTTGEAPQEGRISEKVKARIEAADVFLGVFTRGAKLRGREAYTTSAWVVDEKAYAYAKGKRLLLLKERGVDTIGGIQGDYEYVEFDRANPTPALAKLLTFFNIRAVALK